MKKTLTILAFLSFTLYAKCDVIFFPIQYTYASYSFELIYSYEKVKGPKTSNVLWGGIGGVGSFFYAETPYYGIEFAVERRRYHRSDSFKNFFYSGYIGAACMTNLRDGYDLGVVPGLKINYKAQISNSIVLEPYLGISLPITMNMHNTAFFYVPFPVVTIGLRLGINQLKNK